MPNESPLTKVENLLDRKRPVTRGRYYLWFRNNEFEIIRGRRIPEGVHIVSSLSSKQINEELTDSKWHQIVRKIYYLQEKGIL